MTSPAGQLPGFSSDGAGAALIHPPDYMQHWQGHRRLTRRVIEAFPEEELFTYSAAPPMRPFASLVDEIQLVTRVTLTGLLRDDWGRPAPRTPAPARATELLAEWDELTVQLDEEFGLIDPQRFAQTHVLPWGKMTGWFITLATLDNEIHHRGQGYVYLRALGLQPPDYLQR